MASLLSWAGKKVKGAYDQANPFDGGRTYDTNQRGVNPGTQNPVNIKSNNTPGFQLTNNSLTRGVSRVADQVNPLDNGLSWEQRVANTHKSAVAQTTPILKSFVKAPAQLLNTAAVQIPQVYTTAKMQIAARTHNPVAFENANREAQAENEMFNENQGGLFNAGTIYGKDVAERGDLKSGVTKIGGNVIQDAATLVPFAKGASAATLLGKASLATKVPVLAAEGAAYGGAYNTGQQLQDTGHVDPREVLKNAAITGVLGGAAPVVAPAARAVFNGLKDGAPVVKSMTNIAERHPAVQALDDHVSQLNDVGSTMRARGMSEKNPALINNAKAIKAALQEKQKTIQGISQGGYVTAGGKDVPLFHGTTKEAQQAIEQNGFSMQYKGSSSGHNGIFGEGVYLTKDKEGAAMYAPDHSPGMVTADVGKNLKLYTPKDSDQMLKDLYGSHTNYGDPQKISEYLKGKGYDGVNMKDGTEIAIFDPKKVQVLAKDLREPAATTGESTAADKAEAIKNLMKNANNVDDKSSVLKPLYESGHIQVPGKRQPTPEGPTPGENLGRSSKSTPPAGDQRELLPQLDKQKAASVPDSSATPPHTLNTEHYNNTKAAKKAITQINDEMKGQIESKVGTRLTNKETRELAKSSTTILKSAKTRDATAKAIASRQNLAAQNAALAEKRAAGTITSDELKTLRQGILEDKASGTALARELQARRATIDPRHMTALDAMIEQVQKRTGASAELQKAIDALPDNPTPKQQAEFYRTFVKSTKEDWMDKFRYTNMLSSPLTHIVNMSSNMMGVAGAAPIQKLYEGGVDAARSAITGGPRTRFASEAGSYYKGAFKSVPAAFKKFGEVMSGKAHSQNLDYGNNLRDIPLATHGPAAVADKVLSFVPRLLEAGDQFGTTMARAGESGALNKRVAKGVDVFTEAYKGQENGVGKLVTKTRQTKITPETVNNLADESARYRLFRQELKKTGQGHILDAIDIPAQTINKMRQSDNPYVRTIAKYTVPFVSTPTNIFKQGVEYSPLGIATLHGASDKTAQAAKALMGTTTIGLAAGALAAGGDITFGEPTNSEQRNAFRAEGKQAYSFKIPGSNKWVSYSKMHPAIAMNLAIVGAVKDAEDKGSITDSEAERALNTGAGIVNYFTDQSYMKNVGDFVNVLQGKDNTNAQTIASSQATNTANQLIPFKSLQSWAGRIVDPTQRKVDSKASTQEQVYQGIVKDNPFLNKGVPTRDNPYTKEPLKTSRVNSVLPWQVTTDKGFGNTTGLNLDQRVAMNQMPGDQRAIFRRGVIEDKAAVKADNQLKDTLKNGGTPTKDQVAAAGKGSGSAGSDGQITALQGGKVYAKVGGEWKTYDNRTKAEDAQAQNKFKTSKDQEMVRGNTYYYKDGEGNVKSKNNVQAEYDKQDSQWSLDMDRAKRGDNVQGWLDTASAKYTALEKLKSQYNPKTQSDKIADIENKQEDLQAQADKYNSYGGFTKGGGSKGKKPWQAPTSGGIGLLDTTKSLHNLITSLKVSARKA